MSKINHWNSYGVFCMAMSFKIFNPRELDDLYLEAINCYNSFIESEFNDPNKSELECINEFVKFHNI